MSLATQFQRLSQAGAKFRQGLFSGETPVPMRYADNIDFTGYYSPVRTVLQLEECGFNLKHDTIVRIARAGLTFTPEAKQKIAIPQPAGDSIIVTIEEIMPWHPASAEWVLGCQGRYAPAFGSGLTPLY